MVDEAKPLLQLEGDSSTLWLNWVGLCYTASWGGGLPAILTHARKA